MAAWIMAAALLMKLLVPPGYMPVPTGRGLTIALCTGSGPEAMGMAMGMAMPGMAAHVGPEQAAADHGKHGHGAKDMPCGFGGLAFPSLAAADPIVLALAVAFIVAPVFRTKRRSAARAPARLRPPLRGPPILA